MLRGLVPFSHEEAVSCGSVFGGWSGLPFAGNGTGWVPLGHGLVHLLFAGAAGIGFCVGPPTCLAGRARACHGLSNLTGLVQHFSSAMLG